MIIYYRWYEFQSTVCEDDNACVTRIKVYGTGEYGGDIESNERNARQCILNEFQSMIASEQASDGGFNGHVAEAKNDKNDANVQCR